MYIDCDHIEGILRSIDCHLSPLLKQNHGGQKFNDNREVKAIVTRWLVTQDEDVLRQGIFYKSSSHDAINASAVTRTLWKSNETAIHLNVKCSSYS